MNFCPGESPPTRSGQGVQRANFSVGSLYLSLVVTRSQCPGKSCPPNFPQLPVIILTSIFNVLSLSRHEFKQTLGDIEG